MVDFSIDAKASENDELLAAAKAGCVRSINLVLTKCRRHVESLVFGYLGKWKTVIDVEDVTQFILYEVYKTLSRCRATTWNDFRRFLMTVSRNKTLNFIEREQAAKRGGRTDADINVSPMDEKP